MPVPLSRRAFAFGLPTAGFMAGAQTSPVRAANNQPAAAVTPVAQIKIGRFTVTALSDGYADMPYGYFPGRTAEQVETAAKAQFTARSSGVRFLFNQYLVEDGSSRILIDAGPAGTLGQTGRLPQALAARGLSPDQIEAVIVTHMHQDHLGALSQRAGVSSRTRKCTSTGAISRIGPIRASKPPRPTTCNPASASRLT